MRPSRRLAVAPLLALGLLVAGALAGPAASAAAAESPMTVQLTSPGSGQTLETASVTVSGTVDTGLANLDRVQVVVVREFDGVQVEDKEAWADGPKNGVIPFSVSIAGLTRNGQYRIGVVANGHVLLTGLAVTPARAARSFAVAVRPAAPTGLAAQVVEGGVRLTWRAVPAYPDLMGYAVYRKIGTANFAAIAGVAANTTTYTDTQPPAQGGAVQYRVAALRQGATVSSDPNDWLATNSEATVANLPVPTTTTPPDGTGSSTPPPPASELTAPGSDLSNFFSGNAGSGTASVPRLPTPTVPRIPDTGFSQNLPFPSTSLPSELGGRQPGLPNSTSGTAELDAPEDGLDASNRRALLVPVAAGSVLCVTALHLRWLNRRLALAAAAAGAGGPGGIAASHATADLEPAEIEPDDEAFLPPREPVGAGAARPNV